MTSRTGLVFAPALLLALLAAGCGSDAICPLGYYPAAFGGCAPIDASDLGTDSAGSDLGAGGMIDDTTPDGVDPDAVDPDAGEPDGGDTAPPDLPESDVPEPDVCTPDCDGFECGSDGCGGTCGTCRGIEECVDGLCSERDFPPPADCAEGFECTALCGEDFDCVTECGVFSASESMQSQIFASLDCAFAACGADSEARGWTECAVEACDTVRECLEIEPPAEGACTNRSDLAILEDLGGDAVTTVIGNCTLTCFPGGDPEVCIANCVSDETGLSAGCSGCFGETGSCTLTACIFECLDPSAPGCRDCVATRCGEAFQECAGIAPPE